MNASSVYSYRRRLALAFSGVALLGAMLASEAEARPRARLAFAAVARAADLDPLAAGDTLRPAERAFLRQAALLAQQQLRLAQMATNQAASAGLRTLAQQTAGDYRQIRDSIQGLVSKKGVALEQSSDTAEVVNENLEKLVSRTGADFDREYILFATPLYEEAAKLFELVVSEAKDPEIRDWAGSYLPTVRDHLNRMRDLKKGVE